MSVIINEFEMIIDGEEKPAAKSAAPSETATPKPQQLAPKDLVAIIEHEAQRLYRLLAH